MDDALHEAGYHPATQHETVPANRLWWDAEAAGYTAEHLPDLGRDDFVWGPEGLREADAGLLGPVGGRRVLEVGCGAAQCSRWLLAQGAQAVGIDLSAGMLTQARLLDGATGHTPAIQADACVLPFADASFDLACSAYGAVPFVADAGSLFAEVRRVLREDGRWVFAVPHPFRWGFPDDPGPAGLTATRSYFDETPYVERDAAGGLLYAEHHRTLGHRISELAAAGLRLVALVEPTWPTSTPRRTWGGWSELRGRLIPGTAILVCER